LGREALGITGGRGDIDITVGQDQAVARIGVPLPGGSGNQAEQENTVEQLRDQLDTAAIQIPGATDSVQVTGTLARSMDFTDRITAATPIVILLVLGLGFVLLLVIYRAALLAAAMMALSLLSVA